MPKKKGELLHAKRRFLERAGIDFSKHLNEVFCRYIHTKDSPNAKFVKKPTLRVSIWDITHEGKVYRCVYDKKRKQIVTLLPGAEVEHLISEQVI